MMTGFVGPLARLLEDCFSASSQKKRAPRHGADDDGYKVQRPSKRLAFIDIFVIAGFCLSCCGFIVGISDPDGSKDFFLWPALFAVAFLLLFLLIYVLPRTSWYREDEHSFTVCTPILHREKTVRYEDITQWHTTTISSSPMLARDDILIVHTSDNKKASVYLIYFRPTILLDKLMRMEKKGVFSGYREDRREKREKLQAIIREQQEIR